MNCLRSVFMAASAIAVVALTSCATSRVEYLDAEMAPAISNPGTIVVAGVVARESDAVLSRQEKQAVLERLERKLGQKRRNKHVASHFTFEQLVGTTRSVASGSSDSISFALSPAQVEKAKQFRADFALFVLLGKSRTWCDVDESCTHHEEPIYDKEGNVVDCRHWTEYTTTSRAHRSMRADYVLYDLSNGKKAWEASSEHRENHSRSACSEFCYPPPPPHPAPPTVVDVMDNMSAAAMRKFPR